MAKNKSKRKVYFKAALFIIVFLALGCSFYSKDNYLNDFTTFVAEVEKNYSSYIEEDWTQKEEEYQLYIGDYYNKHKAKLTTEDQKLIGKLKAKYQIIKIKYKTKNIIDQSRDGVNQLEGVVDGIMEEINK